MKARGQFPSFLGRTVPEPQLISASIIVYNINIPVGEKEFE